MAPSLSHWSWISQLTVLLIVPPPVNTVWDRLDSTTTCAEHHPELDHSITVGLDRLPPLESVTRVKTTACNHGHISTNMSTEPKPVTTHRQIFTTLLTCGLTLNGLFSAVAWYMNNRGWLDVSLATLETWSWYWIGAIFSVQYLCNVYNISIKAYNISIRPRATAGYAAT